MPKNPPQDKKSIPKKGKRPTSRKADFAVRARPQTVSRIMQDRGWIRDLQHIRDQQQQWLDWLKAALPEELRGALINVIQSGAELTVLAASAAWSARLRYALDEFDGKIKQRAPEIERIKVKVAPRGRSS